MAMVSQDISISCARSVAAGTAVVSVLTETRNNERLSDEGVFCYRSQNPQYI